MSQLASVESVLIAVDHLLARAFRNPALNGHSVGRSGCALLADGSSWERLVTFREALLSRGAARNALRSKLDLPNGLPAAAIEELSLELMQLGGEGGKQASFSPSMHNRKDKSRRRPASCRPAMAIRRWPM